MPEAALSAEDAKLVTLARSTRARTQASQGAAVRDENGRTYAAASIALDSLQISAVGVCIAMAISSGSTGLEAVVVLDEAGRTTLDEQDRAAIIEFAGSGVVAHLGDPRGQILSSGQS
ncbi:cytidine deaminase [Nocardioides daedukensis]|uniref:Cytidine deaminase n=1 Tax=Nocardioides daedukensis TaxID=634462 RepID=A0A7Y9UUE6_9ACTN|nr:cytidine deaminase [Nocardioides daedukensis]NYG60674.1 cytidine deaminase [Nocardioides daedukensis]